MFSSSSNKSFICYFISPFFIIPVPFCIITPFSFFFCPSALPVIFTKELASQTADEGDSVTLNCELSKAGVPLEWRKGELGLCPCAKYEIRQKVHLATLIIHDVDSEDSGSYTCDAGDRRSTAQLAVKGMLLLVV